MTIEWTIDTCVLCEAAKINWDAVEFLNKILREKHFVAFDNERHIETEYKHCLEKSKGGREKGYEALQKWLVYIIRGQAMYYSGHLSHAQKVKLASLKFDSSDWPFVAVCSNTSTKSLVSEDSDYTEEVRDYLKEQMNIHVKKIMEVVRA